MDKELILFHLEHIKKAIWSMESSSQHPKTSAHYKGIMNDVKEIKNALQFSNSGEKE